MKRALNDEELPPFWLEELAVLARRQSSVQPDEGFDFELNSFPLLLFNFCETQGTFEPVAVYLTARLAARLNARRLARVEGRAAPADSFELVARAEAQLLEQDVGTIYTFVGASGFLSIILFGWIAWSIASALMVVGRIVSSRGVAARDLRHRAPDRALVHGAVAYAQRSAALWSIQVGEARAAGLVHVYENLDATGRSALGLLLRNRSHRQRALAQFVRLAQARAAADDDDEEASADHALREHFKIMSSFFPTPDGKTALLFKLSRVKDKRVFRLLLLVPSFLTMMPPQFSVVGNDGPRTMLVAQRVSQRASRQGSR